MATAHAPQPEAPAAKPVQALMMLPAVLAVLVGFIGLNAALGTAEYYAGFVFVLYWTAIEKSSFAAFPSAVAGSFVGLASAYAMHEATVRLGAAGSLGPIVALICVLLYCQLTGTFRLAINNATMLMLTVAGISHVQAHGDFGGMFISLGAAVVVFGGLMRGMEIVMARMAARAAAKAAPATAALRKAA